MKPGIIITLCNPGIFRTLAYFKPEPYSQPWYIQNHGIFWTLEYSEPEAYSENSNIHDEAFCEIS